MAAMEKTGAKWGDETTVGAGLPTLKPLQSTSTLYPDLNPSPNPSPNINLNLAPYPP